MKPVKKSLLLKTSLATDVQQAGGVLTIGGLQGLRVNNILDIKQIKYRAEVSQVVKIGYSGYTPTADTKYTVVLEWQLSTREGYSGVSKSYSYTTPSVLANIGATAALQREYIHANLIAKINADQATGATPVTAATLAGGTGLTLTDDAGYYPARLNGTTNGRKGPTNVYLETNADGSGWVDSSSENIVTTAGVISFGEGQRLLDDMPVISGYYAGNLISGELDCPKTSAGLFATAGQKYDAFLVSALQTAAANAITGQLALVPVEYAIFVDNGTGSSTSNLTGFLAFERMMQKALFGIVYGDDPSAVIEWFDKPIVFQDPLGAAPTGTANTLGWQLSPYGSLNRTNIGTQTIVAPVLNATGLLIDQDDTAGDGSHTSANQQTLGVQSFVVGKTECSVVAKIVMADWTDSHILVGFRKKAAYTADYNDYTDLAAIGSGAAAGDTITTTAILNNAATVATASAASYTDAAAAELLVKVDINGTVTAYVNGVSYPIYSAGTTAMVFDAGDELIPFYQHVNIGGGDPAVSISKFVAVPSKNWVVTAA